MNRYRELCNHRRNRIIVGHSTARQEDKKATRLREFATRITHIAQLIRQISQQIQIQYLPDTRHIAQQTAEPKTATETQTETQTETETEIVVLHLRAIVATRRCQRNSQLNCPFVFCAVSFSLSLSLCVLCLCVCGVCVVPCAQPLPLSSRVIGKPPRGHGQVETSQVFVAPIDKHTTIDSSISITAATCWCRRT